MRLAPAPYDFPRAPSPPPALVWSPEERARMARGEALFRYRRVEGVDEGLAAAVARAPADAVWACILDFESYVRFLPYVTASRVDTAAGDVIDASFELTTRGIVTRYRVRNWLHTEPRWMSFEMISEDGGAIRRAVGAWTLQEDGGATLVSVRVAVAASRWIPPFARRLAAHRGLPVLALGVARRAEAR